MNLYDEYKNRIEKLAKVKSKLHKFRFLICSALALVIGGSVGLMVAKGSYMSATELSATTVNFNEPFSITPAKAFLSSKSSQSIQYAAADGVWTDEVPYKAGKYQVRTVTPKLVGYSYSKPVSLEILPLDAEFTIVSSSITYGDVPECVVTLVGGKSLVGGHQVDAPSLSFKYDGNAIPKSTTAEVSVDESSLKIIDPVTGEDFTGCYKVTCSSKQLSIFNRHIEVKPVDRSMVYDGKGAVIENKLTDETIAHLAKGDEIRFGTSVYKNQVHLVDAVNAGTYDLLAENVSIWHGSENVTWLYDINYLTAQLEITRRTLNVAVGSATREYDGTPFSCSAFTVDENLVQGHSVVLQNLPTITDIGTLNNECRITVTVGDVDVSDNYIINAQFGTLTVVAKKVTITTASDHKTYDGTALSNTGFTTTDTLDRFEYVADGITEITEYNENKENNNVFAVRVRLNGQDVTWNFELDYVYGTLTIDKRHVTITTGNLNAHYNGQKQASDEEAKASDGGKANGGLLADHYLGITKEFTVTDVTGEKGVDNVTLYAIYDGIRNVTDNYEITYIYGKLIITPRPIVVQILDGEWVYDGEEHYFTGYSAHYRDDESQDGLVVAGDELIPTEWTTVTNYVVDEVNRVTYEVPNANYVITEVRTGYLNITKRQIVVTTATDSWEYDATYKNNRDYETHYVKDDSQPGLLGEDKLTVVGSYTRVRDVSDSGDNVVNYEVPNENYEIVYVQYGTLTIMPREIILITESDSWIYDGNIHWNTGYETKWAKDESKKGLLGTDELSFSTYKTITEVADPNPDNSFDINEGKTPNYKIVEKRWGTLKILPRPIKVVTASNTWVYDGKDHSAEELDEPYTDTYFVDENGEKSRDIQGNGAGLLNRDALTLQACTYITDVGEVKNSCVFATPNDNYTIVGYDEGELIVTGRYIKVVTASNEWIFDGEVHSDISYTTYQVDAEGNKISEIGLTDGDELTVVVDTVSTILNSGWTENKTQFTVVPNADGTANYIIYGYDEGTLTVNKRHIVVTTVSGIWEYDGQNHFDSNYEKDVEKTYYLDEDGVKRPAFIGDDELTYIEGSATVVREVTAGEENQVSYYLPTFDDVHTNYEVEYKWGTLEITKRIVLVVTEDATKEYDGKEFTWDKYEVKHAVKDGDGYTPDGEDGEVINESTGVKDALIVSAEFPMPSIVNVGESYIEPKFENDNYEIHYQYGTLTITPRHIRVTTGSNEWTYDGYEHSETEYGKLKFKYIGTQYPEGSDALVVNVRAGELDILSLVEGSATVVKDSTFDLAENTNKPVKNECEYENYNYQIEYEWGELTVNRRVINISLYEMSLTYGDDLDSLQGRDDIYSFDEIADNVTADGETLIVYITYADINGNATSPKNVGDYLIKYASAVIVTDGKTEQVTADKNYDVRCADGAFKIDKRPLTVTIDSKTSVYGDELPENSRTIVYGAVDNEGNLPYGEKFTLEYCYNYIDDEDEVMEDITPFDAGEYIISYKAKFIDGGEEGLENYQFEIEDGALTITPRELYIFFGKKICTYGHIITGSGSQFAIVVNDGHLYNYGFGETGVIFDGTAEYILLNTVHFDGFEGENYPKNVGQYTVTATEDDFTFFAGGLDRPASNYDIVEIKSATLTIEPKEITVELNRFENSTLTYGETFIYATGIGNYANADDLVLGYNEKLQVAVRYKDNLTGEYVTPKNVGEYSAELDLENCIFYDEYGTPLIENGDNFGVRNYTIICEELTDLEIERKLIYVTMLDYGVTYGDYGFDYDDPEDNPYVIELGNHKTGDGISPELAYGEQIMVLGVRYDSFDGTDKHISPRNVGTYRIRINADDIFSPYAIFDENGEPIEYGTYNYTIGNKPGTLTINKKEVHITLDREVEWTYGDHIAEDIPKTCAYYFVSDIDGLAYSDELTVNVAYYDGEGRNVVDFPKNAGKYVIKAVSFTALYDSGMETEAWNELTNYTVYVDEDGLLTINKREVTVTIDDEFITYGDALPTEHGYSLTDGSFAYEEELTFDYCYKTVDGGEIITPVNADDYVISYTAQYIDGSVDGIDNYDLTVIEGNLKIKAFAITVTVDDVTVIYGYQYIQIDCTITPKDLVGEEELRLVFNYSKDGEIYDQVDNPPINAGTYKIIVTDQYIVGGNERIENYDIHYELGNLIIEKYKVTVEITDNYGTVYGYDEFPTITPELFNEYGYKIYELPYLESFMYSFTFIGEDGKTYNDTDNLPVNAGIYNIAVTVNGIVCVADWGGLLENYEISYGENSHTLEIKALEVTVKTIDTTLIYGDEFDLPELTVTPKTEDGLLPYGEEFTYTVYINDKAYNGEHLSVGNYKLAVRVATAGGTEEGVNNYDITYDDATLEIEKKVINISLNRDVSWSYGTYTEDDTPATCGYDFASADDGLAYSEELRVNIAYYDENGNIKVDFPKNVGKYVIKAVNFTVIDENGEETAAWNELTNYTVYVDKDGLLTITAREITVKINEKYPIYGDALPVDPGYTITEGAFAYGDVLTLDYCFKTVDGGEIITPINAGRYKISYTEKYINGSTEIADNYDLTIIDGNLIIIKKGVKVTLYDVDITYGEALPELNPVVVGMVYEEKLVLTFILQSQTDGSEYSATTDERLNAGIYSIKEDEVRVEGGNELKENYDISYELGSLEIKKLAIKVTIFGAEITYGEAFTIGCAVTSESKLLSDETLYLTYNYKLISGPFVSIFGDRIFSDADLPFNVGVYQILVAKETVEGGNGLATNYSISYDDSEKLVINALEVNVKVYGATITYGDELELPEPTVTTDTFDGMLPYGETLVFGFNFKLVDGPFKSIYGEKIYGDSDAPRNVGTYKVIVANESVEGGNELAGNYAISYEDNDPELIINTLKVRVTVNDSTVTYGDEVALPDPTIEAEGMLPDRLPYNEYFTYTLYINDSVYEGEKLVVGDYKLRQLVATANDTEDGLLNYEITYTDNDPALTISAREITVALLDVNIGFGRTGEYPVEASNYKGGEFAPDLVYGDVLTVTEVVFVKLENGVKSGERLTAPTDAGRYAIEFIGFKITNGDDDVSDCYYLPNENVEDGLLVIDPSVIYVRSADGEWEYDGKAHTVTQEEYGKIVPIDSELPDGYEIVIDGDPFEVRNVTGEAGVRNETRFKVRYNGVDSDNFDVQVGEYGIFRVYARKIEIRSESNQKVYDGTAMDGSTGSNPLGYTLVYKGDNSAETDAIATGDRFELLTITTVVNVSDSGENELTYRIVDGSRNSMLDNYDITEVWGTLQITPVQVQIVIKDIERIYGEEVYGGFTSFIDGQEAELPNGEKFVFDVVYYTLNYVQVTPVISEDGYTLINVGTYYISLDGDIENITVEGGNALIGNYDVLGVTDGNLKVNKRVISVKTDDGEWVYRGAVYSQESYEDWLASDRDEKGLIGGDVLEASGWATIINVSESGKQNTATLRLPNDNYEFAQNGITYGTLKILARSITVQTATVGEDGSIIYDGEPHSEDKSGNTTGNLPTVSVDGEYDLVAGHEFVMKGNAFSHVDASESGVDNTTEFVIMAGNVDVTANYKINWIYGKLIIKKRPISFYSNGITKEYDGEIYEDFTLNLSDDNEYPLVRGHQLVSMGDGRSFCDVTNGTEHNLVGYKIIDSATGADVTDNYAEGGYKLGEVLITPATLTVILNPDVSVQYGNLPDASQLLLSVVGFVNSYESFKEVSFIFNNNNAITGKGTYNAIIDWNKCKISNARGDDGLKNYKLSVESVRTVDFEVTAREITLILNENVSASYGVTESELVSKLTAGIHIDTAYGEVLNIVLTYSATPKNVGSYTAKIDWANCTIAGKVNGLDNYVLINPDATFTFVITKATVTVTMNDIGEVKYGEEYAYPDGQGNYASADGLVFDEVLKVEPVYMLNGKVLDREPTFAGEYDIVLNINTVEVYANGILMVGGTENYTFICNPENYGKLIIKGVNVTVTRQNVTREYNGQPYVLADSITGDTNEVILTYTTPEGLEESFTLPQGYVLKLRTPFATSADAGEYENTAEYYICDEYGNESGEYIVITVGKATITITQKAIRLYTKSATFTYDGDEHFGEYKLYAEDLLSGHSYEIVNRPSVTNVAEGIIVNEVTFRFLDGGIDVTKNYKIVVVDENGDDGEYGTLKVTARDITVTIDEMTTVYGEAYELLYSLSGEETKFPYNAFSFKVSLTKDGIVAEKLNVGNYAVNYVEGSETINGEVSQNYKFTFESGSLKVTVRKITVTTVSDAWVYDGDGHYNDGYETDKELTYYLDEKGVKHAAFVNGDSLTALTHTTVKDFNGDGEDNVVTYSADENYDVTIQYGKLKITKRTITIVTGSAEKTYDGKPLSNAEVEECYYTEAGANDGLIGTDRLELVGSAVSVIDATEGDGAPNANKYVVFSNGEESANYEIIEYVYGNLRIYKKDITIKITVKENYQYGDQSFKSDAQTSAESNEGDLVEGETITIVLGFYLNGLFVENPKDVDDGYTVGLDLARSFVVKSGNREGNGISNYNVICEDVEGSRTEFNITQKDVEFEIMDWLWEYYTGAPQRIKSERLIIPADAFEYGETLYSAVYDFYYFADGGMEMVDDLINVGNYKIRLSTTRSLMSDGSMLGINYNVTWKDDRQESDFEIYAVDLTITLKEVSVDYNGKQQSYTLTEDMIDGLRGSDSVEVSVTYNGADARRIDAGTYTVSLTEADVHFTPEGSKNNYNIVIEGEGKLTINRRKITLGVADITVEKADKESALSADAVNHSYQGRDGDGFVNDDLATALKNGELTFTENKLDLTAEDEARGIVEKYEVTLTVVNEGDVLKNYTWDSVHTGILKLTKTMVEVQVNQIAKVYDGEAVDVSLFSFSHVLAKDGITKAFSYEELSEIIATYTIVNRDNDAYTYTLTLDGNGNVIGDIPALPVNVGDYLVTLTLSGAGLNGYHIENAESGLTTNLTIDKRDMTITVERKGNYPTEVSYGYFNSKLITDYVNAVIFEERAGDRGLIGSLPSYQIVLVSEDGEMTLLLDGVDYSKFDVGTYHIEVIFSGQSNYEIDWASYDFVIKPQLLIIAPRDPQNGAPRAYTGTEIYLEGGEGYYEILKGELIAGDGLYIRTGTLSVSLTEGNVYIEKVIINGVENNPNYKLIINALSPDPDLTGFTQASFRIKLYYQIVNIGYEQVLAGKQLEYTGTAQTVTVSGNVVGDVIDIGSFTLPEGHTVALTKTSFTFTDAGVYKDWFADRLQVVNRDGKKVACYVLENVNPHDTDDVVVSEKTVSVIITVDKSALLDSSENSALELSFDGTTKKLKDEFVNVTGLLDNHVCEVIRFVIEDKILLGVTIFADNNGKRKDVIHNYDCTVELNANGPDIEYKESKFYKVEASCIAVDDIKTLSSTVLRVTLTSGLNAENLLNPEFSTLKDGVYHLNNFEHSALTETTHSVMVVVYSKNGALTVGIVVTKQSSTGSLTDASNLYNVILPEIDGVTVEVLSYSDYKNLVRMLVVDLTDSFEDGTPITYQDGDLLKLQNVKVSGLMTSDKYTHKVEIIVTANGDGTYSYRIIVYQENVQSSGKILRSDKRDVYDFIYVLPDGASLQPSDFVEVDVSEIYTK